MKNTSVVYLIFTLFFATLSAATVSAYEITYTYDKLNRLTSATYDDGTGQKTLTYQYDEVGNRLSKIVKAILAGDFDGDSDVTLADAVMTMQAVSGITPDPPIVQNTGVGRDGKIGLAEAIYILQKVAGIR